MSEVPTITLGDREWNIPILAPKQNRVIVPALQRLTIDDPEKRYALLLDICYAALTRAYPEVTRADFEDMPVTTAQLFATLPIISQQAGVAALRKDL